jgi:hypothetical protein
MNRARHGGGASSETWAKKQYRGGVRRLRMYDSVPQGAILWMAVAVYLHRLVVNV